MSAARPIKALAFGAGLLLAHLAQADALPGCIDGRPLPRSPHVTYSGLPTCHGYERDHIVPLCLLGLDIIDNLQYQPLPQAKLKNEWERQACDSYCRGEIRLDEAQPMFHREWSSVPPKGCNDG